MPASKKKAASKKKKHASDKANTQAAVDEQADGEAMTAEKKKKRAAKKRASKNGQVYVECYQRVPGKTKTPFEAKLIQEGHYHCQIEVDRKRHWINRGACSSTPYTK